MKKQWLIGSAMLFASTSISMAQVPTYIEASPDLGFSIQAAFPDDSDYDLYKHGLTAEMQFRDWFNHPWGYLLAIGYGEYASDSGATKPGSNLYDFDGSLEIIPFGASVLFQLYNEGNLSASLDAGVRYLSTESEISAKNSDDGTNKRFDLDYDDAIIYRIGASADYILSPDFILSVGAGYQDDITAAEVSTELGPVTDSSMKAFFLETALRMPF